MDIENKKYGQLQFSSFSCSIIFSTYDNILN